MRSYQGAVRTATGLPVPVTTRGPSWLQFWLHSPPSGGVQRPPGESFNRRPGHLRPSLNVRTDSWKACWGQPLTSSNLVSSAGRWPGPLSGPGHRRFRRQGIALAKTLCSKIAAPARRACSSEHRSFPWRAIRCRSDHESANIHPAGTDRGFDVHYAHPVVIRSPGSVPPIWPPAQ